jgi:flagellar hook-basal body complex protein FliE
MSIEKFGAINLKAQPIQGLNPLNPAPGQAQGATGEVSFGKMLNDSISELDRIQKDADKQVEGLTLGKEGFTSHSAMIALEQADVAFQLMSAVRSKIVRAYEEILRTQV